MRRSTDQLDDDRMLRDSARGFLEERCAWQTSRESHDEIRDEIAELGWFGMGLSEQHGGLDSDAVQILSVIEEAGRVLLPVPLATDMLVAPRLIRAGIQALAALAPGLVSGKVRLGLVGESARHGRLSVQSGRLTGRSGLSLDAGPATHWLVQTGAHSPNGAALLLVEAGAAALDTERLFDGREGARVTFADTAGLPLATGHAALGLFREIEACCIAAAVADAYGAVASGLDLTVDYLNQRRQFGQTLGSFQAVQHMMADAFCDLETLRSLMLWSAVALDGSEEERDRATAAAKIALGREGLSAASRMIQVSGGIAMTEDYRLGHVYKRLQVSAALHGGTEHHIKAMADATLPAIGRDET